MSKQNAEQLLTSVSKLTQEWFDSVVEQHPFPYAPRVNPHRNPRNTELGIVDVFRRRFLHLVVRDLTKIFKLERCAILLPIPNKAGIWGIAEHFGYPDEILRQRKAFCPNVGLCGLALAGELVETDSILTDPRRSQAHGDTWITTTGEQNLTATKHALLGVPIWNQPSDLKRTTLGAVIAIRRIAFDPYDKLAMTFAAASISNGYYGLETYAEKLRSSRVSADLIATWSKNSTVENLVDSLKIFQRILPSRRMLLSLVNPSRDTINGAATLGFRQSLVTETCRSLTDDKSGRVDILATFVREDRRAPEIVKRDDPAVHAMTALRHELTGDLLLIPIVSTHGAYTGIILAELTSTIRDIRNLSPVELINCALFGTQLADLIENKTKLHFKDRLVDINTRTTVTNHKQIIHRISNCFELLQETTGIRSASIFVYDPLSHCLRRLLESDTTSCTTNRTYFLSGREALSPISKAYLTYSQNCSVSIELATRVGKRKIKNNTFLRVLTVDGKPIGVLVYSTIKLTANGHTLSPITTTIDDITPTLASACNAWAQIQGRDRIARTLDSKRAIFHILGRISQFQDTRRTSLHDIINSMRLEFDSLAANIAVILESTLCELFVPQTPVVLDSQGSIPLSSYSTEFENLVRCFNSDTLSEKDRRKIITGYKKNPHGSGLTGAVLQTLMCQTSANVLEDPLWSGTSHEFTSDQVRCWLGVPLLHELDGKLSCWGVLSTSRSRESTSDTRSFCEDDLLLATHLANCVAMSLARLYDRGSHVKLTEEFLQRFHHDVPDLILHIKNGAGKILQEAVGEISKKQARLSIQKQVDRVVTGLSALQACVSALLIAHSPDFISIKKDMQCNPSRVLTQLRELLCLNSDSYGIKISYDKTEDESQPCIANEEYLVYTLLILVNNSLRSCIERRQLFPRCRPRVFVRIDHNRSTTGDYSVVVEDEGIGFPAECGDPNSVEEGRSFWKVGKQGLGRGRSLVRRLIAEMGGSGLCWRRREAKSGAIVSFNLPSQKTK